MSVSPDKEDHSKSQRQAHGERGMDRQYHNTAPARDTDARTVPHAKGTVIKVKGRAGQGQLSPDYSLRKVDCHQLENGKRPDGVL